MSDSNKRQPAFNLQDDPHFKGQYSSKYFTKGNEHDKTEGMEHDRTPDIEARGQASEPYFGRPFVRLAIGLFGVAFSGALWSRVTPDGSDAAFMIALSSSFLVTAPIIALSVGLPHGAVSGLLASVKHRLARPGQTKPS